MLTVRTTEFLIEDLGIQEIDVYDLEIGDNHNFFANDILVHNSAGLNLEYLVNKVFPDDQSDVQKITNFLDKFEKTYIDPFMAKCFEELTAWMNCFQNKISMKREVIADKGLWRGKKHYILQVYDKEGIRYHEPKLKMMGIETAKSSTPDIVRGSLTDAIKILLNGDEDQLKKYVSEFRQKFYSSEIADIAFPRGVNDIDKWIEKVVSGNSLWKSKAKIKIKTGTPIHVRGAITYNMIIDRAGLQKKYPHIKSGDKIKFVYLIPENPFGSHVVAFPGDLPSELGVDQYVDKELQFNKTFLDPLMSLSEIVGWKLTDKVALNVFFGKEE